MLQSLFLLRGIALGLLLGMLLTILLRFRDIYALKLLAGFCLCLAGYLTAPLLQGQGGLFYVAVIFADAAVLLFLLLVQAQFCDHRRPEPLALWFGGLYLAASYTEFALEHALGLELAPLRLGVRLAMLGGALCALYLVLRNWQADLVEARRRLRMAVSAIAGMYIVGVTLVESLAGDGAVPLWVEVANSAGIVASLLAFIAAALVLGPAGLLPADEAAVHPAAVVPTVASDPELLMIVEAMEERCAYRDMELTIRSLAEHLGIAEHRLRKLINQRLGYRNFNDFLNHYRLAEVARRLADPGESRLPIQTIAMDAGYRSMTTFNRSFRAAYDQNPSAYRRRYCPKIE
ncbi:MAG: helix-turn-helix transcriptional regulator [Halioglobus sp.]|nr:helix-turn-helix transcriptional regulator [Halioglobus sp.]